MRYRSLGWVVVLLGTLGAPAAGQGLAPERQRARAIQVEELVPLRQPTEAPASLRRAVSVELTDVPLAEALDRVAQEASLLLAYDEGVVSSDRRVTLRLSRVPAADALLRILRGSGFEAQVSRQGRLVRIVPDARPATEPADTQSGTVTGRVTDANTGEELIGALVSLAGTRWQSATIAGGRYRITEVIPGSYTLVVRRIGYSQQSQPVTVVDGEEVTVDVALTPVPTKLDEVVTTVTGEQRLRELGHVVGRINADSLVKEAPVSSVTELLNARVPGLQVFTSEGTVGGSATLRVRSATSVRLNQEPIVIVDGVRYSSGTDHTLWTGPFIMDPTTRINDLNPNDIESIEVVKGPSAATLYGTDAANGVIVITTKKGRAGPARWNAYARTSRSEIPDNEYPNSYWGWKTVGGEPSLTSSCRLSDVVAGTCVQDSVTVLPNPLNNPELSIFGRAPRWEYGANVSGGGQNLRYYFSADFEDATGPVEIPDVLAKELREERGVTELPDELRTPNTLTKLNLRTNVSADLSERAELRVSAGYTQSDTRTLSSLFSPYSGGAFFSNPTSAYGFQTPAATFSRTSTEGVNRFYGSASGEWRPLSWLQGRATVGIDLTNRYRYSLQRRGDPTPTTTGTVGDIRTRTLASTFELGGTATFDLGGVSSRTSVGAQYVRTLVDGVSNTGYILPPGGSSIGEASIRFTSQNYDETVTLGSYIEQVFGFNDRLFLTGALRIDGASNFGQDCEAAVYPKAGVSWIASEEPWVPRVPGLDELRLRYAFGAAGQQPTAEMRRPSFSTATYMVDGRSQTVIGQTRLGSPLLRPERVKEHEFGLDASALEGRLHTALTWNRRRTVDQIGVIELPTGLGYYYTNIGLITGRGFEAQLTARLLDTRPVSWDLVLTHASNTSEMVDLGGTASNYSTHQGSWVEGYPIGARFMRPLLDYEDANGDGIIDQSEVQMGDSAVYVGQGTPSRTQTLTAAFGLFERRVRLSALVERRSGFIVINGLTSKRCGSQCRAAVDPTAPLADQARVAAKLTGSAPGQPGTAYDYLEQGDFTRLREVSVSWDLPTAWVRAARLGSATVSLSGRNLALWTDYDGPDPESARLTALASDPATGIPHARTWTLRLDLGL